MSKADEAANKAADQFAKAKVEIDGVIADLQGQSVSPETLARLNALSQSYDDVVPDAPAEPETPEVPEPEVPETPAEPETPETPAEPEAPTEETPAEPEAPAEEPTA